ncbi:hypothetical protein [Streptomyces sp. NPDC001100]
MTPGTDHRHWGQTNGSSFRVFARPENSGNYSWWDRTVPTYSFYTRDSGQNCASADGVVRGSRAAPRSTAAARWLATTAPAPTVL